MDRKILASLILIVILAFFLRFYRVTEVPPSLNWDEVSIGYNAYSIMKTGRDEWGQFLPIHFQSYGEYKLPAQIYASIPGIAIFGLNELGVRITPVVYGTLTVLVLFFLAQALFRNYFISLTSALLLAISPWHIHLTRSSFESSFSVLWILLGLLFLVKGFEKPKYLIWSMIPFAIAVYTYNATRIFTPLFLLAILIIYRKYFLKYKKIVLGAFLIFFVFCIPLIPFYFSGEASARYKLVSITDEAGLIPRINENRGNSTLPQPLPRLIHNKVTYLSFYFVRNYLAHFSPQFLFISGAPHLQHHVQDIGELYVFQAPFLLIGLYLLFKKKNQFRWLLLAWIIIIHIPVATTRDSIPHALRTVAAAPFYQLMTALGIYYSYLWVEKKKPLKVTALLLSGIVVLISIAAYLYNYYVIYPVRSSKSWQYGYKQVVDYISRHQNEYNQIVFTRYYGEPHMFSLFYLNYNPASFQTDKNLVRFKANDWVWVLKFDKFYFASNGEQKKVHFYFPNLGDDGTRFKDVLPTLNGKRTLFIGTGGDFPKNMPKLLTIDFLDGNRAFEVVEVK